MKKLKKQGKKTIMPNSSLQACSRGLSPLLSLIIGWVSDEGCSCIEQYLLFSLLKECSLVRTQGTNVES